MMSNTTIENKKVRYLKGEYYKLIGFSIGLLFSDSRDR